MGVAGCGGPGEVSRQVSCVGFGGRAGGLYAERRV